MKKVTLKVPDKKLPFFLELVKQLGPEIDTHEEENEIPEEHKKLVRNRIKNTKKNLLDWKSKSPYDPEFVAMIQQGDEDFKKGKEKKITLKELDDLWK